MKVTFILETLFVQGAEYATSMMVLGFIDKGYEVDVLLSRYHVDMLREGVYKPYPVPDKTNVVYMRKHKARDNIFEIRKYLKNTDSVAVICMSPNYTCAVRIASIGLKCNPKLVHVEHALASYNLDGSIKPVPKKYGLDWFKRKWFWNKFDRVLTVSKHGEEDFHRMNYEFPREHIATVWNPVISAAFAEKKDKPPKHPWLKDKPCFTFVSAGVLEDYKAQIYLLEAMRLLKDRGVRARLVLFGKGSLRPTFEKFIADNQLEDWVDMPGHSDQYPAEAAAADAFVLPSEMESFGIVIVEALASGLPVVSTDAPFGPREILEDGKYGTLVPVKDSVALADAMQKRVEIGKVPPSDESWKRFTVEAAVERYEKGIGL